MSRLMRAARRLRDEESGFSLVELLVSVMIGLVVISAAFNLLDASTRASADVTDRVDATQRGRAAMEQIQQVLRSQVCLNTNTPAITYGDPNRVDFYADFGDENFTPEARRLRFVENGTTGRGDIFEDVWTTLASPPVNTYNGAATRTRVVMKEMARAREDQAQEGRVVGDPVPVFRYYSFVGNDPARPDNLLATPLSAADKARVVRVAVAFDSQPGRRTGGRQSREELDTTYENDIYVRTADPTDPLHSPQCL
jgi:prepilin-type N-terminal cleavage/methylation domain-containing protein